MKKASDYKEKVMGVDQAMFTLADQLRSNLAHYADIHKMAGKLQRVRYLELLNQGFNEEQALQLVKGLKPFDIA